MTLETVSTGRMDHLVEGKLAEAKRNNTPLLSLSIYRDRSVNNVYRISNQDKARIQQHCLANFKSYGLSKTELRAYMLLDGVVCPFYISCHYQARSLGYTISAQVCCKLYRFRLTSILNEMKLQRATTFMRFVWVSRNSPNVCEKPPSSDNPIPSDACLKCLRSLARIKTVETIGQLAYGIQTATPSSQLIRTFRSRTKKCASFSGDIRSPSEINRRC